MKKILIDTNSINGRRSALIDGDKLIDFDLEFEGNNFQKGSIHKGKVTKIEASLEAIFVELGSSRHGFLPFKELSSEYFDQSKTGMDRFIHTINFLSYYYIHLYIIYIYIQTHVIIYIY